MLAVALLSAAAPSALAHPPMLKPLDAVRYLSEQRAGFGAPAHAAALASRADAHARTLSGPSHTISATSSPKITAASPSFSQTWTALGPAPMTTSFYGGPNSGRVDSAAVVQSGANAGEIFVGTAGGGVWSSTDNGKSWVTHTDQVASGLAIGALAIDPNNPSTIYAGTGEANNCGDCFYGGGLLKSTDAGQTWTVENPSGIFSGVDFSSLTVDPNNSEDLYAGTSAGLYESTDGGVHWSQIGSITAPTSGVALDPSGGKTTVYAAVSAVGIEKSTDGGSSFLPLGSGELPKSTEFGVTALGIGSGGGHETLYAAVQLNGSTDTNGGDLSMYKSINGGGSWTHLSIPAYTNPAYAYEGKSQGEAEGDQAGYDNTLAVDPSDPEHVVAAGMAPVESKDGGAAWSNINGQNFFGSGANVLHPDFHATAFAPSENVVIGCDGGVYEYSPTTPGPGPLGVSNLNANLNTGQLYEDLSVYENGAKILGGLQDNGTAYFTGSPGWPEVSSGDGGYSAINPLDVKQQFAEADMHLEETTNEWVSSADISPPLGVNGNFVPPMTIVPNSGSIDKPTVYYGGADLWVTADPGGLSPTWTPLTTVGATAETAVSAIAVAPSNPAVVYVGFDNGTLLVSNNANLATPTFTDISVPGAADWITHIDVAANDPGSIAVSFAPGGTNTQHSPIPPMVETGAVTLTGIPSATYTNITGNLPNGVASNSVASDNGALIVATDVGVFSTSSPNGTSTSWSAVGTGLPNVQVIGLSIDEAGDLYAATHGRGVWKLATKTPQTISFTSTPPSNATVGGPAYNVAATGGASGEPVVFTIDAASSSACSISGSTVSFIGVGTCTIDAYQDGDSSYEPAPQVQQSFTVAKGAQSISFTSSAPPHPTLGGPSYTATATASSGLPVTLTIDPGSTSVCSITAATITFTATGTCTIDANQAGNSNYEPAPQVQQAFSVSKSPQTIAFTSSPPSGARVAGPSYTVTATATSGLPVTFTIDPGSTSVCSITAATITFTATGTCTIDANQAGNSNYEPAPTAQQSLSVLAPSNLIRVTAERQNTRTGTVSLTVLVSGPGLLSAKEDSPARSSSARSTVLVETLTAAIARLASTPSLPKAVAARRRHAQALVKPASVEVTAAGTVTLQIRPTAAGKARLKRRSRLVVKLLITFAPTGGAQRTILQPLTLARNVSKKHK